MVRTKGGKYVSQHNPQKNAQTRDIGVVGELRGGVWGVFGAEDEWEVYSGGRWNRAAKPGGKMFERK